jgi:hypothetical protein
VGAIHRKIGSNVDIGKSLGRLLRNAGFQEIHVMVVLCSPSTVGWKRFLNVVQSTAEVASSFHPDLFEPQLLEDLAQWLGDRSCIEQKDPYICSAIADAVKP